MLNVVAVVGTYSRGGFIGLCIIAAAAWLRSKHKLVLALAAALLIPTLYMNTPEEWRERQSTVSTAATEDSSFIGRLWAWKISTLIALDDPMTGGGYRAVTDPSLWHYYGGFTPNFGPVDTPSISDDMSPLAAHNIYFQVLGDHGFIGLILFLLILGNSFLNNYRNYRYAVKNNILWMASLSRALNVSIMGYCITGLNVSLAYFDLAYAIFGIVVVVNIIRISNQKSSPSPSVKHRLYSNS
jgi:probable O-glycosylation ligase (exosortase A-associated)